MGAIRYFGAVAALVLVFTAAAAACPVCESETGQKVRAGICALDDTLTEVRRDEFDSRPEWMFDELGLVRPASRDLPLA